VTRRKLNRHTSTHTGCLTGVLGVLLKVLYHVWREHTPLWNDMLAEVYVRMGAPTDGPPADLPHRILVRYCPHSVLAAPSLGLLT